jgi:cellulose 1,4-beta-cellobiosidase
LVGKTTTGGRLNLSTIMAPAPVAAAPAAPTGLAITAGAGSVKLTWNASAGATSYIVKRSTTVGGPYTTIATVTTTTYTDTTVSNGTQYFYVVAAVSSAGSSLNSTEVSATPQAAVTVAAPTGVSGSASQATVAGNSTVTLHWTAVSGATSYQVKRATTSTGTYTTVATGLTATSYTQSVTANNNVYYYRVDAVVGSTVSADSATATVSAVSPAPTNLTSKALSSTQAQINWADHSADEQGFKIEYWTGYSWAQIGTIAANATTATITGTSSGGTYYFRVRAYNGTLNTAYTPYTTITMP